MRTTLKRGLGRVATVNGNGRVVLPPPEREPMRHYRQPPPLPRSTGRMVGKVLGWIMVVLLVIVSGLGGGLYLYAHETLNALATHSKGGVAASKDRNLAPIATPSQPATALVIGYDARMGADASAGQSSRSDTLMLIRADPTNKTLSLLSFPRDLQVPIYCHNSNVPIVTDRINSAWARCGQQGTLDTVAHLTGVSINYLISVNFHGFKLLVNKLHGVYVDVDHRYINTQGGPGGFAKIDLEPGYQLLDGQEALDFVRFRHTDSDLYRLARQQLFLVALKDRLASSFSLTEIPQLIGAVKGSVEVVKPGASAPSFGEMQSYVGLGYHLPAGHIFRNSIPNLQFCGFLNAQVCTQPADVQTAVDSFEHPDVTLPTRANNAALGLKAHIVKPKSLKPAQVSTLVLNGTTVPGLASDTSYKLAMVGYHTTQLPATMLANAPTQTYASSDVYFDTVQPHAKQAAKQLQTVLGPHTIVSPLPAELSTYAQQSGNPLTIVVVGSAFNGQLVNPQASITPTPVHQPPAVRIDPGLTLPLLQSARRQVPFRLYVPHAIESSSNLTSLEPLRVFKPASHRHEVVLTFVTGAGNVYWQIIQTDWTEAPILRKPTATATLTDGRKVDLYTTGGNIHMVALRQGNASYWVINTLRDELSNETMLAIAKGLQPLGR
jgi:LCP family protein required for cell wall assembly